MAPSEDAPVTLAGALEALADERERGFTFVGRNGEEKPVPFASLLEGARRRAAALGRAGLSKGDRVVVIVTEAEDFLLSFFGMALAGIVPVPVYPPFRPDLSRYAATVRHIIATAEADTLLADPILAGRVAFERVRKVLVSADLDAGGAADPAPAPVGLDDTAFIQFTSGSTSSPKGVVLAHRNVAANVLRFMDEGLGVGPGDVCVSWLPLYHDMGLIGHVFGAIYRRMPIVVMSPLVFIRRPAEWLRLMTRHRGTVAFAPNFAYGLCAARVKDLRGLDLGSWRVAGCGSEPISCDTLTRFAERFAPAGFRREAFLCAYGMAESTLAVTFSRLGAGVSAMTVDADALHGEGVARPADGPEGVTLVSCGRPFSGHEVAVVDEKDAPLPEGRVGEIVTRGPSVMEGYYRNEEATREAVRDGWLHSGDLGFVSGGELYVCGRSKELIIVAGRNYYPQDIEWAAGAVEGVRTGNVIAFGVDSGDTQKVVVVAETRSPRRRPDDLKLDVRKAVQEAVGIRVDEVVLAPPGTLPKTSSGKLRRRRAREEFLSGELLRGGSFVRRITRTVSNTCRMLLFGERLK